MNGSVVGIYVAKEAGSPMQAVSSVMALQGQGLAGDRYCYGDGSFNKGNPGKRQVTFINSIFFTGTTFDREDSRRNIITYNVELMWLIGREFQIGDAVFKGVKYCEPCNRPSKLAGRDVSFQKMFFDRGGLVAEVLKSGLIRLRSEVVPPPKGY